MAEAKKTTPNPEIFLFKLIGQSGKEWMVKVLKNATLQMSKKKAMTYILRN